MFYVANSAAVTSVTAHYTTSGGVIKPGIMVMEISGAASSDVFDGSVGKASRTSVNTSSGGSFSTTNANDVLIFATDTAANQAGWTAGGYHNAIPNNKVAAGASGSNVRQAMQYSLPANANGQGLTYYTNSAWNGNIFAAFKIVGLWPGANLAPYDGVLFGNQQVGTSARMTATVESTGTEPLTISSISITGTNSGDF